MRPASAAATPARITRATLESWARRLAFLAALILPAGLLYSRVEAEICMGIVDCLFLIHCAARRRWDWLRAPWMLTALVWWGWMVLCSTPVTALRLGEGGGKSLLQAALLIRFFVLAAALAEWVLHDRAARKALFAILTISAAWIVLQCWQQYMFGRDLFGWPRWSDGALTGPFRQPRAGPALILILFPVLLPVTADLMRQRSRWARMLGLVVFAFSASTMVLIGQRMPALLTGLGLLTCGIALPRLRPVVLGAVATAAIVLLATPLVSPPTFQKLVVHFAEQMDHFPQSPYGQLFTRAAVMGTDNAFTGLGFDGFRAHCLAPRYQHGLPALGLSDAQAAGPVGCSIHPHNHYLEAFTSGGLPGLLMFAAMGITWLLTLGRGLMRGRPGQVGCFIAVLLVVWPFASTSAFFTLPNAGWLFLVLGLGLGETAPATRTARDPSRLPTRALALTAGD